MTILIIGTVSFSSNFAVADDGENKKPQTLTQFCSTLDNKDDFKSLVCSAILGITSSIQNLQVQINQMQFTAQRCPPGQEMVGINVNRQIICENPNFQSATPVIVTINPISVQIPTSPRVSMPVALAAVGLSPNSQVTVTGDDGLGHVLFSTTGTSDNKGGFSFSGLSIVNGFSPGTLTLRVIDANGRTGSATLTLT